MRAACNAACNRSGAARSCRACRAAEELRRRPKCRLLLVLQEQLLLLLLEESLLLLEQALALGFLTQPTPDLTTALSHLLGLDSDIHFVRNFAARACPARSTVSTPLRRKFTEGVRYPQHLRIQSWAWEGGRGGGGGRGRAPGQYSGGFHCTLLVCSLW